MEPKKMNDSTKRIILTPPKQSGIKIIWNILTFWRPLTKHEGGKFALMILKLSEAILNLKRVQTMLVKNNNLVLKQLQAQKMLDIMKEEENTESIKKDKAFQ